MRISKITQGFKALWALRELSFSSHAFSLLVSESKQSPWAAGGSNRAYCTRAGSSLRSQQISGNREQQDRKEEEGKRKKRCGYLKSQIRLDWVRNDFPDGLSLVSLFLTEKQKSKQAKVYPERTQYSLSSKQPVLLLSHRQKETFNRLFQCKYSSAAKALRS